MQNEKLMNTEKRQYTSPEVHVLPLNKTKGGGLSPTFDGDGYPASS